MASPVDKNAVPSIKVDDYDCENTKKDRTRNEGHVLSNKDANVSKCRKPFKISGDSVGFKTSSSTGNLESVNPSPLSSAKSKSAECLSEGKVMKAKHASGVTDLNFSSKKPLLQTSHKQLNGKSILSTEKHQPQGLKISHSEENVAPVAVGLSSNSKHISQKTQPFSYLVSEEKVKKQLPTHSPPPNRQPPLLQTPTVSSKRLSPKTGSPSPNQQPPLLQTPLTSSKQSPKTRTSPPNQAPPLLSTIPNDLQQSTTDSDPPNKPPLLHTLMADTKQSPKTCSPPPNRAPPLLRTPSDDLQKSCLSPISSTPPNPKPSLLSISTDTANQSPKSPTFSPLPHRQPLVLQDSATSSKQFPKSPKSVPPNRPPQPAAINLQKLSSAPKLPSSPVLLSTTNKELFQCPTVRLPKTNEKPTPSTTEKIRSPLRVKFSLSEESSVSQISEIPIAETSNMDVQTFNIIDHQDADLDIHSPNNSLRKEAGKASKNASTASSPIRQIKSMGDLGKVVTNSAKVIGTNLKTSVSAVITAVKKSPKKLNFPKVLVKNKRNKNSYASLKRSRSADDLYSHIGQFSERSLDDIYLDIIGDPDYVNIGRSNSCDIIVQPVDGVVEYINMGSSDIDGQLADDGLDYINIMSITSNETEEGISAITKTNNMAAIPSADGMGAITKTDNMAAITKVDNMAAITKANMPSIYTDVVFTTNYNIQSFQDDQLPSITTANKMPSIYTDVVFTTHYNTQSSKDDQPSITTAEDMASITSTDDMAAITIGDNMATISSSADSISKTPDNTSARDNQRNDSPGKVKELQKIFDSKLKRNN